MSRITEIIEAQGFERVRDRVAEILYDEIYAQFGKTYDDDLNVAKVFIERCIAFDKIEMPAINVSVARNASDNHNAYHSDGTVTIHVDAYHRAETKGGVDGTSRANIKLQKLIGICRAILQDARYLTLGFAPGFIGNRHVVDINFRDEPINDGTSMVMARLRLSVRTLELNGLAAPRVLAGYETQAKLYETDEGYYYFGGPDAQNEAGFNYDLDFNL